MEDKISVSLKNKTTSQSKLKKILPSMKLSEFRIKEKLDNDCIFIKDDDEIDIEDENDYKIKEILSDGNKIYYIQKLKLISIFIENKKIHEENLSKETKIYNLRELLYNKINNLNDYLFSNEENDIVDKENENEFTIGDLLNKKNKIILKPLNSSNKKKENNQNSQNNQIYQNNQNYQNNEKWFFIYINNREFETKKFFLDTLLIEIKEKLSYRSKKNLRFLNNGFTIGLSDETKIKLSEISTPDNKIYLKNEKKNNSDSDSEGESDESEESDDLDEKKKYKIMINGNIINNKKLKKNIKLNKLRNILSLPENQIFFYNNNPILKQQESDFKLKDIARNKTITIQTNITNIQIKIVINGKNKGSKNLNLNDNLMQIRRQLSKLMPGNSGFYDENDELISKDDEKNYKLDEIINKDDNSFNIKTIQNEDEEYRIIKNGMLITSMILNIDDPVIKLRMLLGDKINSVSKFLLKNNNLIDNNYEQILKIRDIELNKNIYIQEIIEEKKEEKIEQEKPKKTYKIFINNKNSGPKKCSPDFSLIDLKQLLVQKFDDDEEGIFLLKQTEGEININDESNYTIDEIAKNGNVYLITKKVDPETREILEFIPNKPIEGSNFIKNIGPLKIYHYPYGSTKFDDPNCHTIIVLGETGSGKTTLLNSLINYCVGIDYKDDFRYYIINENTGKSNYLSQTSTVNVYYIKSWSNHPSLRIIDTPGFGDNTTDNTIKTDNETMNKIHTLFKSEIDFITAVCLVVQSANAKLTKNQEYIFSRVVGIFGKDIEKNILPLITFCDANEPPVIHNLKAPKSFFHDIFNNLEDPWYLKFNNSGFFNKNNDSEIYWKIGFQSFDIFMTKLGKLKKISLNQTNEVLEERKRLHTKMEGLLPQLNMGLSNMEEIRRQIRIIEENEDKIDGAKNFEIEEEIPEQKRVHCAVGQHTTLCHLCNFTCHKICYIPPSENKRYCASMKNGICTVCPNKCEYTHHSDNEYYYEYTTKKVKRTLEELKNTYVGANKNLSTAKQIIIGLNNEFNNIFIKVFEIQEQLKKCIERLNQIALKPNIFKSSEEYIDILINSEELEKKEGYKNRIVALKKLKKEHQLINEAFKGQSAIKDLEDFKNNYIKKKVNEFEKSNNKKNKNDKNDCIIF